MSLIQITREGPVTILTLDRAETMNPLGAPGDGDEFVRVANAINRDMECRAVILTGAGRAFSAGGDIKAMQHKTGTFGGTAPAISDGYRDNIHLMLRALEYSWVFREHFLCIINQRAPMFFLSSSLYSAY